MSESILDAALSDIKIPWILPKKINKRFSFKSWIQNAKTKTENFIRSNANALADWILNKEIAKRILPAKIQNLLEIVKKNEIFVKNF